METPIRSIGRMGGDTNVLSYLRPLMEKMLEYKDSSEITITFKQSWRNDFTNDEIIKFVERYFRFLPLNNLKEVILVPEYGANKNLHFHGIIRGKAKSLSELKGFLNKRFGRSTISNVKYVESYVKYLLKEQEETDPDDIIHMTY